jgi:hypothetical protein
MRILFLCHHVQTISGAHPASYLMGTGGFFPLGVKELGHEVYHSPLSSAEVKNALSYGAIPPFPQYIFTAWCLVKHRDNFTYTEFNTRGMNNILRQELI